MTWKVPEEYRLLNSLGRFYSNPGDNFGAFYAPSPLSTPRIGRTLIIMASPGGTIEDPPGHKRVITWEHVSVHGVLYEKMAVASSRHPGKTRQYTPTWKEMDYVKSLFWDDTDIVVQLHVNGPEKVNRHDYTLHLWRPTDWEVKLPPQDLV
jgi:hypothetical protein